MAYVLFRAAGTQHKIYCTDRRDADESEDSARSGRLAAGKTRLADARHRVTGGESFPAF